MLPVYLPICEHLHHADNVLILILLLGLPGLLFLLRPGQLVWPEKILLVNQVLPKEF
jgi:hypothetical protein